MSRKSIQIQSQNDVYADCEWAFGLNRMMLNVLGIWPDNYKLVYFKELRIPCMLLWIFVAFFLPQIYALVKVYPNLTLIIDNLLISCSGLLAFAKLFIIWHNKKMFVPLVRWMEADWMREKEASHRDLMLRQARRGRFFTLTALAIMSSSISSFVIAPIIGIDLRIVNNITDLHERRYFPTQSYYPYDFVKSPNYELTYVSQVMAAGFAAASFSAADSFFGALVFHAAGQCEILSLKLNELFHAENRSDDDIIFFKMKLCQIVDMHVYLIRFVVKIEQSFNILVLSHSLGLSVIMCCVGFGVLRCFNDDSSSPPIIQIFMLLMSMVNTMLHMLIYCSATEILNLESTNFIQAVYGSNWYLYPAKYSHDVIPLMMRSQYPFQLTVGKFFYLSLNLYVKILKTSAGFISMLLAVK